MYRDPGVQMGAEMIFDIRQTKTGFDMEWQARVGDQDMVCIRAPFSRDCFLAEIQAKDYSQRLVFDPSDLSFGNKLKERLSFRLYEDDKYIGHLVGNTRKERKGLFAAYPYYEYQYREALLSGYEVGFGRKGIYLCVYEGQEQIAVVEKKLSVTDFKDEYICYLLESRQYRKVIPFVIYYDTIQYGDVMERAVHSKKKDALNTIQKDLIAKFDRSFIPRVLEQDGIRSASLKEEHKGCNNE
ncbi:MAG: hypothetical protein OSJ69_19195 [Acetatifactor sp.]|nr:hypothetical protein [Acetatifactor sp.]